jgi:NADH:ubiquinone oxidoreductase subunit C
MKSEEFRKESRNNISNDSSIEDHAELSESAKKVKKETTDITRSTITTEAVTPAVDSLTSKLEQGIINKIVSAYGNKVEVIYVRPSRMKIRVPHQDILHVATFIKENFNFDHAESVSGTDYPKENQIEIVYHLSSYSDENIIPKILALSARVDRDDPRIPSLISVFRSVEYHERETYEMVGVYFEGHPRMERFLLPEDWADIPPLRKDFRIKGR